MKPSTIQRKPRRKRSWENLGEISPDLNSLLDIVFILLIFTMLAMQLGKFQLANLDFPETEMSGTTREKTNEVPIYILNDGRIRLRDVTHSWEEWERALDEDWSAAKVLIASEKQVPFEKFALVLDRVRKSNPKSIELGLKEK